MPSRRTRSTLAAVAAALAASVLLVGVPAGSDTGHVVAVRSGCGLCWGNGHP